jgi:hypothetical protein
MLHLRWFELSNHSPVNGLSVNTLRLPDCTTNDCIPCRVCRSLMPCKSKNASTILVTGDYRQLQGTSEVDTMSLNASKVPDIASK